MRQFHEQERRAQIGRHDRIPFLFGHVGEHPIAQDAGVVDEDVEVAELGDRRVDEALGTLPARHVVGVGDRMASQRTDLGSDLLGGSLIAALAVVRPAEVVDDHLGALLGEQQRVLPTDPASGTGDDRDSSVE